MVWRNSSRCLRLASLSRSAAWSVFFTPLAHLPQHLAHPTFGNLDARTNQSLVQLRFGQVRLLAQPTAQARLHLGIHSADRAITLLNQPFLLASTCLLDPDLLRIPPAHTELGRQFAQTSHSSFIGIQKLQTQIIRIGLGHRLVFAEIAETNLPLIGNPGYSNFGSALRQQLAVLKRRHPKPRLALSEKLLLVDFAAALVSMEGGIDFHSAGDSCSLASGRGQAVLAVA